jgi:hypothetical protein
MKSICNHAHKCSKDCPHKTPHEKRDDCGPCHCFDKEVDCTPCKGENNE